MEASPSKSIMNPVYIPPVMFHLPHYLTVQMGGTEEDLVKIQ